MVFHHIGIATNNDEAIKELEEDGAVLVKEPKEAIVFNNKKVAFLMWHLGLIELINRGGGYIIAFLLNYVILKNLYLFILNLS